jgi:hypothetical protein
MIAPPSAERYRGRLHRERVPAKIPVAIAAFESGSEERGDYLRCERVDAYAASATSSANGKPVQL